MADDQFRAGVGRVTITPPLTAPHASWGAQVHVFPDGVEADLWATVLVVAGDGEMAAIVDLDVVIVSREESDAIRAAVAAVLEVPPTAIRVSVTHNHAGPPPSAWDWTSAGGDVLRAYFALLPSVVAGAARLALRDLRPARIGVGAGESRVAVNRRERAPDGRVVTGVNPDGLIDPRVLVLRLDAVDGGRIAAVVGYTMHPTTLGPSNRLVSPDWPGHLKRTVETLTGATCLFAQGATGNIGPGPDGFTDDIAVVHRLGAEVGCEAARVFLGLRLPPVVHHHERTWESGAPLGKWRADAVEADVPVVRTLEREIALPVRPQPPVEEAHAAKVEAEQKLEALRAAGAPVTEIEAATFVTKRANMTLSRAYWFGGRETFASRIHLLQVGHLVFAGTELEPFAEIGLAIQAGSPFRWTWFGGYTGGWYGYVPTPDAYPLGGYEVDTSPYTETAAGTLVEGTLSVLRELQAESVESRRWTVGTDRLPTGPIKEVPRD